MSCPGRWWSYCLKRCPDVALGDTFWGGEGGAGVTVGLDDPEGLSQPW